MGKTNLRSCEKLGGVGKSIFAYLKVAINYLIYACILPLCHCEGAVRPWQSKSVNYYLLKN